jgi:integrase
MMSKRNRRAGVDDLWRKTIRDPDGTTRTVPSGRDGRGLRWRARYVDDDGREHTKAFGRKSGAQAWLDSIISAHVTGTYIDPQLGKVTFASFYRDWSARQVWVSGTRHTMNLAARSVTFNNIAFADLRPSHVETWVKSMQDRELEPSTIRTRFRNVRSVLRAAVHDRVIGSDPSDRIRLPRVRKAASAMIIPTTEQVGAAIAAAPDRYAAFIAVCAFAGLRRGEASALKVSDVDFMRKEIHVRRQVQWTEDGRMELYPPKYGSERTVYVPQRLVEMLAEHVRQHRPEPDPDRWLFPGSRDDGRPAHAATVARSWRLIRAELDLSFRLHDLRHFYASGLIAAGCDVVTVQRALGHSSAAITLTTYSHLWPDASDRTRKAAGELLDQSLGAAAYPLRTESEI